MNPIILAAIALAPVGTMMFNTECFSAPAITAKYEADGMRVVSRTVGSGGEMVQLWLSTDMKFAITTTPPIGRAPTCVLIEGTWE